MSRDADSKRLEEITESYRSFTHPKYDDEHWLISKLRESWADLYKARAALERCTWERTPKLRQVARECLEELST